MGYAHLAREERYYICQAVKSGTSLRAIAKAIGRSVSTVSRELARNTGARGYRYRQAHKRSQKRQTSKGKKRIGLEVWTYVEQCLHQDFSPEQFSGVLKRKGFALSHAKPRAAPNIRPFNRVLLSHQSNERDARLVTHQLITRSFCVLEACRIAIGTVALIIAAKSCP